MTGIRPVLLIIIMLALILSSQQLPVLSQATNHQIITMPYLKSGPVFSLSPYMTSNFYLLAFNQSTLMTTDIEDFRLSSGFPLTGPYSSDNNGLDIAQMTDGRLIYDREYFYSDSFGDTGV